MSERDKILERIRKLKALAERGGTPEEAEAAAAKIRQLIADYGLDQADVDAAEISVAAVELGRSKRQIVDQLAKCVAYACGCTSIMQYTREGLLVIYVGPDPAPVIATYLHEVCYRSVEEAAKAFRRTDEYRRRRKPNTRAAAVKAFKAAMIERLGRKLVALGWLKIDQLKRLQLAYERRANTTLRSTGPMKAPSRSQRWADARQAGDEAGRQIDIHRPVNGGSDVRLIGQAE